MRENNLNQIEVHVAGICLRKNKRSIEVLAAKRADTRNIFPGKWECGGGQVNPGENFKEAIIRQHKEELNINSKIIQPIGTYEILNNQINQKKIPGICFLCETNTKKPKVDGKELVECRWIPIEKIDKIDFIPGMTEEIRNAGEIFKK